MSAIGQEATGSREQTGRRRQTVLLATLHGGPYDGAEDWMFRPRTDYLRQVPRGTLRRVLRRPPRYAWYHLASMDESGRRADYVFKGLRRAR